MNLTDTVRNLVAMLALLSTTSFADNLTVDEVVERNLAAKGGRAEWADVHTVRIDGQMTMGPDVMAPFSIEFKRPQRLRMEFELNGQTGVQVFDGQNGWVVMPFLGATEPQPMSPDQLRDIRDMADFDGPLVGWREKGHRLEYRGMTDLGDRQAHTLTLTRASGDSSTIYLDGETFLEHQQVVRTVRQGQEVTVTTTLSDYRPVGDLVVAHSMQVAIAGAPFEQQLLIGSFAPNVEIADSRFQNP